MRRATQICILGVILLPLLMGFEGGCSTSSRSPNAVVLQFASAEQEITEGDTGTTTVELVLAVSSGYTQRPLEVTYQITDVGSPPVAERVTDGTVMFGESEFSVVIPVTLINNLTDEGDAAREVFVSVEAPLNIRRPPALGQVNGADYHARITVIDNDELQVLSISPNDGAVLVDVDTPIEATFSQDIDLGASGGSISLQPATTGVLSSAGPTLSFQPDTSLLANTTYTATAQNATDTSGNQLPDAFMWSFSTGGIAADTLPPRTAASPPGGAFTSSTDVTLTCTDTGGSGCANTFFCLGLGCAPTNLYSGPVTVAADTQLRFYSDDNAGNDEAVNTENYSFTAPATVATYGTGTARAVVPTSDGGLIVVGNDPASLDTVLPPDRFWVYKLSDNRDIAWSQSLENGEPSGALDAVQTDDGGALVVGYVGNYTTGDADFLLVKLDTAGAIQWQQRYDLAGESNAANGVARAPDGGYLVVGESGTGAWALRVDSSGASVWQRSFSGGLELLQAVTTTQGGGFVAAGSSNVNDAGSRNDVWLISLDANGDTRWQYTYGTGDTDQARAIVEDTDGSLLVAGQTNSVNLTDDGWVLKISADGATIDWQIALDGGMLNDRLLAASAGAANNWFVLGNAGSDGSFGFGSNEFWLLEVSDTGVLGSQAIYGGTNQDLGYGVTRTPGGIAAVGVTQSFGAEARAWLLELDGNGFVSGCTNRSATTTVAVATGVAPAVAMVGTATVSGIASDPAMTVTPFLVTPETQCGVP